MKKISVRNVLFTGIATLLLTACARTPANVNAPTPSPRSSPTPLPSPTASPSPTPSPTAAVTPVVFVDYENRAVGYRILRPDKWYWQHLIRSEIGDASPLVDDYFMADRNPLPQLGSEYLGMIVIEVSRRNSADIAPNLEGFTKTEATVGGQTATHYAGVRDNQVVANQTWIEYQSTRNGRLFRFIYANSNTNPADEAAFEEVVKSFTFNQ